MYTLGLANALNLFSSLFSMRDAISFFFASMKDTAFLPNPFTNGMSRWRFGSRTTNAKEMMAARKEKRRVHLFHCNCSCSSSFLVLDGFLDSTSPSPWSSITSATRGRSVLWRRRGTNFTHLTATARTVFLTTDSKRGNGGFVASQIFLV